MCRSHPIRNPIARDIMLPVIEIGERLKKPTSPYKFMHLSPKERRMYQMSQGRLVASFNHNSNRIVRERRTVRSSVGIPDRSLFTWDARYDSVPFGWRKWKMRGGVCNRCFDLEGNFTTLRARRYIPECDDRWLRGLEAEWNGWYPPGVMLPRWAGSDPRITHDTESYSGDNYDLIDIPIWTRIG